MDSYNKSINVTIRSEVEKEQPKEETIKTNWFKDFGSGFADKLKESFKPLTGEDFGKNVAKALTNVFDNAWDSLKNLLSDSWKEFQNMLDYSTLANARTRELAFTYGFTGSQAYGYDKALSAMGMSDIEDLYFAEDWQKEKFYDIMTKNAERYQELYDSGFFQDSMDFQYEMQELKQEMMLEIVQFFMDNKDLIKSGMMAMLDLSKFVISALGWIVKYLGNGERSSSERLAASSDIINSYSNSNRNTSVKIDNTFNNVAKEDQTWLSNAGQMTYEQVIQALT